jgi:hypothetical protein
LEPGRTRKALLSIYVTIIGPKITSTQTSRREMLELLFDLGLGADQPLESPSSAFPDGCTPLSLAILTKGMFEQDEHE